MLMSALATLVKETKSIPVLNEKNGNIYFNEYTKVF